MLLSLFTQPLYSSLRIEEDAGYLLAYQSDYKLFCPGFNIPIRLKYSDIDNPLSLVISLQYTYIYSKYSYPLTWTDPLTSLDSSLSINALDYYHIATLGMGLDYNLKVNWQANDTKALKYFYPYIGADLNFYFLGIYRETDVKSGTIPDYLFEEYRNQFRGLTPTIGATARLGTRIRMGKKDFLNLMAQYSVLIPEESTKKLYVNHFIQFHIGYERQIKLLSTK